MKLKLTRAEKKFLCLSLATIIVLQAGRLTRLYAGPPSRGAAAAGAKSDPGPAPLTFSITPDAPLDSPSLADAFSGDDWFEIEFNAAFGLPALGAGEAAARAVQCVSAAAATGPGTWIGNTSDPNYGRFQFPFRLSCTPPAGATEGCEPFVFVVVTYKWIGGVLTNIATSSSAYNLECGFIADGYAYSHSTIDDVTGPNGGPGSYRSSVFVYKYSDFAASNWSAYLAVNYYDWTF